MLFKYLVAQKNEWWMTYTFQNLSLQENQRKFSFNFISLLTTLPLESSEKFTMFYPFFFLRNGIPISKICPNGRQKTQSNAVSEFCMARSHDINHAPTNLPSKAQWSLWKQSYALKHQNYTNTVHWWLMTIAFSSCNRPKFRSFISKGPGNQTQLGKTRSHLYQKMISSAFFKNGISLGRKIHDHLKCCYFANRHWQALLTVSISQTANSLSVTPRLRFKARFE